MPGWHHFKNLIGLEFKQSLEEGRDRDQLQALRREFEDGEHSGETLAAMHARILEIPIHSDFPFQEPDDLEEIRALRPQAERMPETSTADSISELPDKMYGAWLGRCIGCALGKPVEMFMNPKGSLSSRERLKRYLTGISADEWPLRDYIPAHSPAESESGETLFPQSTREQIAFMETDDDIRYTVIGQLILQTAGRNFTTWDVARMWIQRLSYGMVCTAETQAYRNLVIEHEFHGDIPADPPTDAATWHRIATHLNPYREWIGAQIRADSYGYAAPGNPTLAAEFAYRDARLSHVKNGIYGAMFCAAMIAAAFVEEDVHAIIQAGLDEIPATSRLYSEIMSTLDICKNHSAENFEAAFSEIEALVGHYNPVHTNNNLAICVAAIALSEGNFDKGVTLAVMGGWDTDCNGATVGSVLGTFSGASRIPPFWKDRLNDTLHSGIIDYHPITISECARRSVEIATSY